MSATTKPRPSDARPVVDLSAPGVYEGMLRLAHVIEQHIRAMPLEEMVSACREAESIGPILDPTLFIKKGRALSQDKQVLQALASAQRELVKIRARYGE